MFKITKTDNTYLTALIIFIGLVAIKAHFHPKEILLIYLSGSLLCFVLSICYFIKKHPKTKKDWPVLFLTLVVWTLLSWISLLVLLIEKIEDYFGIKY